jgi:hypothetical protein
VAEFASNPARLSEVAAAIRANIEDGAEGGLEDEDEWEAPEGELLTRIHRRREPNRTLVARKKGAGSDLDTGSTVPYSGLPMLARWNFPCGAAHDLG